MPGEAVRPDQMQGEPSTFARVAIWDETDFAYYYLVDCAHHCDARHVYLALHEPPFIVVEWVRYGRELIKP